VLGGVAPVRATDRASPSLGRPAEARVGRRRRTRRTDSTIARVLPRGSRSWAKQPTF